MSNRSGKDTIGAIGLLDLYGPDFYPSQANDIGSRYRWAKEHFEREVAHPKFRQHFAVHEVEAWRLADANIFPPEVCRALPAKCGRPETVNFTEPPKQLLRRLFLDKLQRNYKEVTDGATLFQRLDPTIAYGKCPHLKLLLDDMLKMAKDTA